MSEPARFRISTLAFLRDREGRFLLLERNRPPNQGCWSPIGGKLHMDEGESPYECACREIHEEAALEVTERDLHLFGMVSEKNYEGSGHWLMFLFACHKPLDGLPPAIDEGRFGLFSRAEVDQLRLPDTDRRFVWEPYDRFHDTFFCLRADCSDPADIRPVFEQLP